LLGNLYLAQQAPPEAENIFVAKTHQYLGVVQRDLAPGPVVPPGDSLMERMAAMCAPGGRGPAAASVRSQAGCKRPGPEDAG